MNEVLLISGMAAVTLLIRYPMLALVSRVTLPEQVIRGLRFVPVAVLTAIIVPAITMPAGKIDVSPSNAYLWVGIVSAFIAWRTRSLLVTIVAGMAIFLIWRAIIGGA